MPVPHFLYSPVSEENEKISDMGSNAASSMEWTAIIRNTSSQTLGTLEHTIAPDTYTFTSSGVTPTYGDQLTIIFTGFSSGTELNVSDGQNLWFEINTADAFVSTIYFDASNKPVEDITYYLEFNNVLFSNNLLTTMFNVGEIVAESISSSETVYDAEAETELSEAVSAGEVVSLESTDSTNEVQTLSETLKSEDSVHYEEGITLQEESGKFSSAYLNDIVAPYEKIETDLERAFYYESQTNITELVDQLNNEETQDFIQVLESYKIEGDPVDTAEEAVTLLEEIEMATDEVYYLSEDISLSESVTGVHDEYNNYEDTITLAEVTIGNNKYTTALNESVTVTDENELDPEWSIDSYLALSDSFDDSDTISSIKEESIIAIENYAKEKEAQINETLLLVTSKDNEANTLYLEQISFSENVATDFYQDARDKVTTSENTDMSDFVGASDEVIVPFEATYTPLSLKIPTRRRQDNSYTQYDFTQLIEAGIDLSQAKFFRFGPVDFNTRILKHMAVVEIAVEVDSDVYVALEYNYDSSATYKTTVFKKANSNGIVHLPVSAINFKIVFLVLSTDTFNINYIRLHHKYVGKSTMRGVQL